VQTLSEYAQHWLERLSGSPPAHPRFTGQAIDPGRLSDLELGSLLPWAERIVYLTAGDPRQSDAQALLNYRQRRQPIFTAAAARDYFEVFAQRLQGPRADSLAQYPFAVVGTALATVLSNALEIRPAELADAVERILSRYEPSEEASVAALLLAGLIGEQREQAMLERLECAMRAHPWGWAELVGLMTASHLERAVLAATGSNFRLVLLLEHSQDLDAMVRRVAALPVYPSLCRPLMASATAHAQAIQSGLQPYAADQAFSTRDADALTLAACVALLRDEPWLPDILGSLLAQVCVAPNGAKTLPSQSVAIGLAHMIQAFPTPESVEALRSAHRLTRHAGVKKKLERSLRVAQKALGERPEVALRLPSNSTVSKQQLTVLARALETGYVQDAAHPFAQWQQRLIREPATQVLAESLIWRIQAPQMLPMTAMLRVEQGTCRYLDATGAEVPIRPVGGAVRLWHPLHCDAPEREAWREFVVTRRIKQPFRQAFREYYCIAEAELDGSVTTMFANYLALCVPVLGLAQSIGWRLDAGELVRDHADYRLVLAADQHLYPGLLGAFETRAVRLLQRVGRSMQPLAWRDAPALLVSESLREVDLLVSVGSYALAEDPSLDAALRQRQLASLTARPASESLSMRRHALEHIFSSHPYGAHVVFDERHARVGDFAVHLSTARVTRRGDPIAVPMALQRTAIPLPWLPYDETLLERVAHTVAALVQQEDR
jgi:hypothetical protein